MSTVPICGRLDNQIQEVELLMLYSSCNHLVTTLRRLLELPERPAGESSPQVASVRRRPPATETEDMADAYATGVTVQQLAANFGFIGRPCRDA